MANDRQPSRSEATILAAVLAVVGAPLLFDKLGFLVRTYILGIPAAIHVAPLLLVAVGAILLLADQNVSRTESGRQHGSERGQQ